MYISKYWFLDFMKGEKIVATLCYVQKDERTLMLVRNRKENDVMKGKHSGLGGKCEKGEDPYNCIVREVKEEAGIDINPIYVANLTFKDFQQGIDWEVHLFRAEGYEGELIDCNEGELVWVPTENILDVPLWPGDKIFLPHLNSEKFFFARFEYEDGELKGHWIKF